MSRRNLIEVPMVHWRIVVTLVAVLLIYGVVSFLTMPRQEFPDFTIRQGLVIGVMPGATSAEVEEQLAKPVEEYLFSFQEVNKKKTYSVSRDGQLVVFVELNDRVKGPDAPAFWAKLRHGLNELRSQKLSPQVLALIGNNDFGDTSALLFTVVAEGHSPRDLEQQLEVLESHLRRIDATSKLRRFGLQEEVIRVTISRERLARYGIRPATVWLTLQGLGGLPAPVRLDDDVLEVPVHVSKVLRSESELGETILLSEPTGPHVRLKDVATITREYGHDDAYVRFNGRTALVLSIEMQTGHDITRFGKQVDEAIRAARADLPPTVEITRVADQPHVVKVAVGNFLRDFGLAIIAIIVVTMLLLPLRVAAVAALTIPICIFITLGILNALGVQLQTVSLAGLIVVLGMIVDNTIVIVDDHVAKLDLGMDPWRAAWKSVRDMVAPVFTATLAIIMAYVPLAVFMKGMGRDFIGSLPVTIASALFVSLLVAVTLVPILNHRLIRRGLHGDARRGDRPSFLDRVQGAYNRGLQVAFGHPRITLGVGVASVVAAVVLGLIVAQQLFPKVDRDQFAVEVYLPNGRPLTQTDEVVRRLERELLTDRRVVNVTSFIGTSSPRFHTVYAPNMPARHYAQLLVNTRDEKTTLDVLKDCETRLGSAFPEGWVRWKQLDFQPAPAPIEVRLSGNDIRTLKELAQRIEDGARRIPGTTWVRNDFEEPLQAVSVIPDPDACARLGVSPAFLQAALAVGSSQGLPVATIWEGDYPVRVLLGDDPRQSASLEAFRQQYVSSPFLAATVPLEQLATIAPSWEEGAIVRRNGVRTLTVRVDVDRATYPSDVQRRLGAYIGRLGPIPGVRIEYGGEHESVVEQYHNLSMSLAVSVAAIYLLLLFQFKRHRRALLVMLTMPLSLLGCIVGLAITHYPFGLTAFVGTISLMGLVVRNGILLVDHAENLRHGQGLPVRDAAVASGQRRLRPIFLTSTAAAVGVIPMILSGSTLWGPLGAVTCFGLLFSMALTLIVLPVAYWLVTRGERPEKSLVPPAAGLALVLALSCLAAPAHADETPITLDQCRALTLRNNAQIQETELNLASAQQARRAAFTSYFPQVSATGVTLSADTPLAEMRLSGSSQPASEAIAGMPNAVIAPLAAGSLALAERVDAVVVSAVQPVFTGGRIVNGNRLAALGVTVARDRGALARRDALAQTEEKYWRLVGLTEKERTLRAYEGLLATLEAQASDAVAAGLATSNDLLKVSLRRRQTEVDRLRLESGLHLAARDLRRHIGLPEADTIALADSTPPAPVDPCPLADQRMEGAKRRLEIRLLEWAVKAEQLQTSIAIGAALPTVSVGAEWFRYDISGIGAESESFVFGMVSVPISGAWKGTHETLAQREKVRAAEVRLADARELIGLDIDKSWDELRASWLAVDVAEAAVEQAEVNLKEESDRHESGLTTLSDLLEAQVLQHQALEQRIDARSEFWLKRSAYLRAVGVE